MTNYDELFQQQMLNDEVKAEYEALAPQYEIIRAIIKARTEQNITQAELARRTGVKQSNISRLESGCYNPSVEFLAKIASGLGMRLHITLM